MEPVAGVADIVQQLFLQTAVAQKVGSWAQIPSNLLEHSFTPHFLPLMTYVFRLPTIQNLNKP